MVVAADTSVAGWYLSARVLLIGLVRVPGACGLTGFILVVLGQMIDHLPAVICTREPEIPLDLLTGSCE